MATAIQASIRQGGGEGRYRGCIGLSAQRRRSASGRRGRRRRSMGHRPVPSTGDSV